MTLITMLNNNDLLVTKFEFYGDYLQMHVRHCVIDEKIA